MNDTTAANVLGVRVIRGHRSFPIQPNEAAPVEHRTAKHFDQHQFAAPIMNQSSCIPFLIAFTKTLHLPEAACVLGSNFHRRRTSPLVCGYSHIGTMVQRLVIRVFAFISTCDL